MRLEEVCELIIDAEHKTAPTQLEGYPSIRTPNIGKGRLILDGVNRVSEETYNEWTKRAVPQAYDLILAREAPVGNVAIIPENELVCLGQRTVLLRPDFHKVHPMFLCYFLLSDEMQNLMLGKSGGSTVPHLNMKDIRTLELGQLPPLPTQRRIAAILSAYDDLIGNNLRRIKLLEEAAQHIYREWFVRMRFPGWEGAKFGEEGVPEGWRTESIGEYCEVYGGGTPSTKEPRYWDGGGILWFSPTDLSKNSSVVLIDCAKKITDEGLQNSSARLLPERTILMSSRATIGLFGIISQPCCTNQGFINVVPKNEWQRYYILFNLMSRKHEIEGYASGATFKEISKKDFRTLKIITPPDAILLRFNELCKKFIDQIENLEFQNNRLKEARDILLPRLMNQTIEV